MAFGLGKLADPLHEGERFPEIVESKCALDAPGFIPRKRRSVGPVARWAHLYPATGAFSFHCNIWHWILGFGASTFPPTRRYDPRTRAELIRSIFRQSHSAKANLARWAYHGCPWLLVGASPQHRRPDLDL